MSRIWDHYYPIFAATVLRGDKLPLIALAAIALLFAARILVAHHRA